MEQDWLAMQFNKLLRQAAFNARAFASCNNEGVFS